MVKASFFCEIAMVTRGFETRLQILSSKVLWYVALVQSRPRFYMAPASADFRVRMAEWLRPGLWEMLMLSRGIEPGQILASKKPTG